MCRKPAAGSGADAAIDAVCASVIAAVLSPTVAVLAAAFNELGPLPRRAMRHRLRWTARS